MSDARSEPGAGRRPAAVGGVVLAAGAATRFGSPKQLAPLHGRPLLEHACLAIAGVPAIEPRVVVLGARADEILSQVDLHGARPVLCPRWEEGQSASLAAGLNALGDVDAAVVMLADEPHVTPELIGLVLEHATGGRPARAAHRGVPRHPVVIPAALFEQVRGLTGDRGAREVLAAAGVRVVETSHLCGDAADVDTPADLESLR